MHRLANEIDRQTNPVKDSVKDIDIDIDTDAQKQIQIQIQIQSYVKIS